MTARKVALSLLCEYESLDKYINLSLNSHKADSLSKEERSFLTALIYTSVEHKLTYDYYISALSKRSIDKIDIVTKNILRIGFAQILDMDKIPEFAAVNETVNLAGNKGERAFVNGVLRSLIRKRDNLPLPDKEKNFPRFLSVKYSFPIWTVRKFISVFGERDTERLLGEFNKHSYTDLTVNTLKISVSDFCRKLLNSGYECRISDISPNTVRISGSVDPRYLAGYDEGEFFVQDTASSFACSVLAPRENDFLVDVCALPGGKSFTSAILMKDKGIIKSFDIHENKHSLIESGIKRLSLSIIDFAERDATKPDSELFSLADRVVCDVPCSGLGVLSKKPDLRYRSEKGTEELPELQYTILRESAKYLKPGGRMIYSTCTLNPDENERVVERFLSENKSFHTVDFEVSKYKSVNGSFTFIPHIHNTDGFFVSLLEKDTD